MLDLLIDIEYHEKIEAVEGKSNELREEFLNEFKETLALTNIIFNKMGKPLQTLETLEKYVKQLNSLED